MTSGPEPIDRWSQLSSLLDALLDTPPERRTEVIAELSGGDPARRAELERLLAEIDRESPLIDAPAAERFERFSKTPPPPDSRRCWRTAIASAGSSVAAAWRPCTSLATSGTVVM